MPPAELDSALTVFTGMRKRLFGIAYRMLGSVAEAEDVVQETWLRWQATDRSVVKNPEAFLTTTATRLAINLLSSAHHRRETYVGPWLPEPVDTSADPFLGAERAEALSLAVLVLLERLTPTERAAYVLREAFDYPYADIARIVQVPSEPAARQLVSRARKHVTTAPRSPVDPEARRSLLEAFLAAARVGDIGQLVQILAEEVVSRTDSGGAVRNASRIPVVGRLTVARYLHAFAERFWPDVEVESLQVNGGIALGLRRDGDLIAVLDIASTSDGHGVEQVFWQMNPAKLDLLNNRAAGD